jgi:branched-chain amino acid transport system substrate-binding protein
VKAYKEYGLAGKLPLMGPNALVDDTLLPAMGDAALGIVSVGHYSATLDTPGSRAFVREYEARYNAWPTRHSENGYVAAQLIVAAVNALKGEVDDRAKFRDGLKAAVTQIQAPRGPIQFDRYQQAITHQYVMKVARQGNRLVNAIVDQIPNVSQEETWKWWNK